MKHRTLFLFVPLLFVALPAEDLLARGNAGGRAAGGGASRAAPARSYSRPAPSRVSSGNRNPLTGSQISRPVTRPTTKPAVSRPAVSQPVTRPSTLPSTKPSVTRPAGRPTTLPSTKPANRPATLPSNRPQTRPSTKPGNITYPKPDRPTTLPANRPGLGGSNRPGTLPGTVGRPGTSAGNRPSTLPATRPGWNNKPIQRPDFNRPSTLPGNNRPGNANNNWGNTNNNWWNSGNQIKVRPGVRPGYGNGFNNNNITINNNFQKNVNWSTNRNHWGYNPWWNRPATRPWYGGSWNCGWNHRWYRHYYPYRHWGYRPLPGYVIYDDDDDLAKAIGWGLVGWGLGKLVFDSGYNTYHNPYPAQPVATAGGPPVTYSQPITVVAAATAPKDEAALAAANQASEGSIEKSQAAFKQKNYLAALESANQAVAASPGDGALHEYRALVLFALAKYGEAAGVLNPVLASGPGWDWSTMVTLYDSQETYTSQFKALEKYSASKPGDAAAHFLLGYHLMVCGHIEPAAAQFEAAAKLQPADSVSRQLADLCKASSTSGEDDATPEAGETPPPATPAPEPVPLEKLAGTWIADRGDDGIITMSLDNSGKYLWTYKPKKGEKSEFGGEYSMNENGLLVLDADGSQMVAAVELRDDKQLKFVLAGGPPGDQGLQFTKG